MGHIVLDIETDGLSFTKIHCMVAYSLESKKYTLFIPRDKANIPVPKDLSEYDLEFIGDFEDWCKNNDVNSFIMHNGISFDREVLRVCLGFDVPLDAVIDTLILSRLVSIENPRHSVEYYGELFGVTKPVQEKWDFFTWPMMRRCLGDVKIQRQIYNLLMKKAKKHDLPWSAYELERDTQAIMLQQTKNGFYLDPVKSQELLEVLSIRHKELTEEILSVFPTKAVKVDDFVPKITKNGDFSKVGLKFLEEFCDGLMAEGVYILPHEVIAGPCTKIEFKDFNLDSSTQRVERLQDIGWKPIEFTKAGNPKFTQESVELMGDKLPDEVKKLGEYLVTKHRLATVQSWLEAKDENNYVHGQVNTLGTRTHRMSHNNPNMGNVARIGSIYGEESRACWTIEDKAKNVLLGCDASGIQLRALAHYAGDKDYIDQVIHGDIHSVHAEALGCSRNDAKTFIYAWLLNAGPTKLGAILGGSVQDGREANARFVARMPFLGVVKKTFEAYGETSDFKALDGRRIFIPSAHLSLSTGLQSFESIVMKWVMREYHKRFNHWFAQRNMVHDEFQIETEKEYADDLGTLIVGLFEEAGKTLGSLCPLTGEYSIGYTWADTH